MPKKVQTTTQLYLFHRIAGNAQNSSSESSTVCELEKFQVFKLDLEKAEEPDIKLPTSVGS